MDADRARLHSKPAADGCESVHRPLLMDVERESGERKRGSAPPPLLMDVEACALLSQTVAISIPEPGRGRRRGELAGVEGAHVQRCAVDAFTSTPMMWLSPASSGSHIHHFSTSIAAVNTLSRPSEVRGERSHIHQRWLSAVASGWVLSHPPPVRGEDNFIILGDVSG
jgi:hypothetical protein